MIEIRKSQARGYANHGWLQSFHSFSFADYYDPQHMSFGPLQVINEDRIAAGMGFGMHAHHDMEIISYMLDGELAHKDSMGNGNVIRRGDVQRMSAGRGLMHSEFNPSHQDSTHLLQIWIQPNEIGIAPSYEEKHFPCISKQGVLLLIASPDGRDGSVLIHQDAYVYATILNGGESVTHSLNTSRLGYVHMVRGSAVVNSHLLMAGDALKIWNEPQILLEKAHDAEVLVFDLRS